MKQRKATKILVDRGGSAKDAMLEAGYSPRTAHTPQKLTESDGFKELADHLGLTTEFIAKALYDDIKSKPGDRSKEIAIAAKLKGLERQQIDMNINAAVVTQEYNPDTAQQFADYLKQQTTG